MRSKQNQYKIKIPHHITITCYTVHILNPYKTYKNIQFEFYSNIL